MEFESPKQKAVRVESIRTEVELIREKMMSISLDGIETHMMIEAVMQACEAALEGNYGIGAVLMANGQVAARGHNQIADPSNPWVHVAHAELTTLAHYHASLPPDLWDHRSLTMFSTLEPCPMCTFGMLNARIPRVKFGAIDEPAGLMFSHPSKMPPLWRTLLDREGIVHELALVPEEVRKACRDIFY